MELWKIFNDEYIVSSTGRVYNTKSNFFLNQSLGNGYNRVAINRKMIYVHRLVAQCFIPNIYNKPEINHIDGNKTNNELYNLEWVTRKENIIHNIKVLGFVPNNPTKGKKGKDNPNYGKKQKKKLFLFSNNSI